MRIHSVVFLKEKALCTKGGGMLTVQCTDVSQSMCAYLVLKWSIQNSTDLRNAKKASFLFTFDQAFFLTLWKLLMAGYGNGN